MAFGQYPFWIAHPRKRRVSDRGMRRIRGQSIEPSPPRVGARRGPGS
jgi:hypothetical protein